MKAVGITEYGGPSVVSVVEVPEPHTSKGEVRIRVRAAGINPVDVMLRTGLLKDYYAQYEPPFIPGMDVAGVIDEVGEDVGGWAVDQEVIALVDNAGNYGGQAEYVVVPAASVAPKPEGASFAEAASFLMSALTAHVALDTLNLKPGQTLGVTGGAGAVGGYAIELAAQRNLEIIADAAEKDKELLESFGADIVVPRSDEPAKQFKQAAPEGLDAVIDGAVLLGAVVPAIREGGSIVILRGWEGEQPDRDIKIEHINVRGSKLDSATIGQLTEYAESNIISMRVAATFPIDEVAKAHELLEQGGVRGRVVLEF